MPKLRKQRRKQTYQYNVNRRALNRKMKKMPEITNEIVKNAWSDKKTLDQNLMLMGLVADPNKDVIKINRELKPYQTKKRKHQDQQDGEAKPDVNIKDAKLQSMGKVVGELEDSARKAKLAKNEIIHPLPPEMVKKLTKFLDKFGEDYEEMAKDHTNYYQETPAQLKRQIERLKKIPQQWIPYLKSRNLIIKTKEEEEETT